VRIIDVCEDFIPLSYQKMMEVVDTGNPQSNAYYALGDPKNIEYTDENGNTKRGMVILCPRCGGSGANASRTLNRLHGSHQIPKGKMDQFGGGCHTKRLDSECVGGLMAQRSDGTVLYPYNPALNAEETGSKAEFEKAHPEVFEYIKKRAQESQNPALLIKDLDSIDSTGTIPADRLANYYNSINSKKAKEGQIKVGRDDGRFSRRDTKTAGRGRYGK